MTAAELLRRKADEHDAIGSEHSGGDIALAFPYALLAAALRDVADCLEKADE